MIQKLTQFRFFPLILITALFFCGCNSVPVARDISQKQAIEIVALLNSFPHRRFLLVGDSGEQDPEVYGSIHRQFPDRIEHILIRNVTASNADDLRFRTAFAGIAPSRWTLFTDPNEVELPGSPG